MLSKTLAFISLLILQAVASIAIAGDVTIPHTFTSGTPAVAAEVNANFGAVKTAVDDNNQNIVILQGASSAASVEITDVKSRVSANELKLSGTVTGCAVGSSIRAIAQDGTVSCETDNDTVVQAGPGLTYGKLGGTQLSIDPVVTQVRVSGVCGAGYSIRAIAENGAVTCELDNDTQYSAGNGLQQNGTVISKANGAVSISPASFVSQDFICNLGYFPNYGGVSATIGISGQTCLLFAGLQLPDGATLTQLSCTVKDNTNKAYISDVSLIRATYTGGLEYIFSNATATVDSASIVARASSTVVTPGSDSVLNDSYTYHIRISVVDTGLGYQDIGVYGCRVRYTF